MLKRRERLYNVQWQIGTTVVRDPGVLKKARCYLKGQVAHLISPAQVSSAAKGEPTEVSF